MTDLLVRMASDLRDRLSGSLHFRVFLQPTMASLFAIRSGRKDAKTGNPLYFWILIASPPERAAMLKDGFRDVGKVFLLALALDVVYQGLVLHWMYPGEALIVAFILAVAPYVIVRGVVTRLLRARRHP